MNVTSQTGIKCPFLDQSTLDRKSGSRNNTANCVDGRERGLLPDSGCWC